MKKLLLLLLTMLVSIPLSYSQGKEFRGRVFYQDTELAIPGVSLVIKKEMKFKGVTDKNGEFTIPNAPEEFHLTLSKKGFIKRTFDVKYDSGIAIFYIGTSKVATDDIHENGAYGASSKNKVVDPSGGVRFDDETSGAQTTNSIFERLRAVPGVQVVGTTITIRGPSSVNSTNAPTIVLDGSVYTGDLSTIDPTTISKIEVVKGSAAALYGSRGATGVIEITTKQR